MKGVTLASAAARRLGSRARALAHLCAALAWVVGSLPPAPAVGQSLDLRNSVKKLQRYLEDGFCDDALVLATTLSRREDGSRSFEVWFAIARAHYCKHDVAAALVAVDELERALTLTADQSRVVRAFTEGIEASFGQLAVSLPGGREGAPRLAVVVIELEEPDLRPFAEEAIRRAAEGLEVPGPTLYLPRGRYEVDWAELEIDDFPPVSWTAGREKPSPWRRSQIGEGVALGMGVEGLIGFDGEALTLTQLSGEEQVIAGEDRLSTHRTPYFAMSYTLAFPVGTLDRVAVRVDGRYRPQSAALGGVAVGGDSTELVPAYSAVGAALQLQRLQQGWTLLGGAGLRAFTFSYVRYIGFVEDSSQGDEADVYRIPIDAPAWGGGPELIGSIGRSLPVGSRGLQIGLEGHLGIAMLFPLVTSGQTEVSSADFSGTVTWSLIEEYPFGTCSGVLVYARMPLL